MRIVGIALLSCLLVGCVSMPGAPGKLIEVDGHKMHLHCAGPEHELPTVVIEAGFFSFSPVYSHLQQELARHIRTCSYDRAGLGWSEPTTSPRDAKQIAAELNSLLHNANIAPPYILAGHSLGGLFVLRYQHDFPGNVAGLVLLDSSNPFQTWEIDKDVSRLRWAEIGAGLGLFHIYNPVKTQIPDLSEDARAQLTYFSNQASLYNAAIGEKKRMNQAAEEMREITDLNNLPLLVITAGKRCVFTSKVTEERRVSCAEAADEWMRQHDRFASLSNRGRHVTIPTADHVSLVVEDASVSQVVKEIMSLIAETHNRAPASKIR